MNTHSMCFLIVSFISRFLFVPWVCWCCCCCRFFIVRRAPYFEHRFSSELCLSLYEAHNPYTLRRCRKLYEKQHQIRTHFIYLFIYILCFTTFSAKKRPSNVWIWPPHNCSYQLYSAPSYRHKCYVRTECKRVILTVVVFRYIFIYFFAFDIVRCVFGQRHHKYTRAQHGKSPTIGSV